MIQVHSFHQDHGADWYEEAMKTEEYGYLILVGYGKCLFWVEGEKIILQKGELLFIPPGTAFYGKNIPTILHEKYVVKWSNPARFTGLPIFPSPCFIHGQTAKFELYLDRFQTIAEEWREETLFRETLALALVLEVLTYWSRELEAGQPADVKVRHAELMKGYIQNHYREKVTKVELGKVIERSPNYAAALFHEVTGQTISGYVNAYRIKTAVYMLLHSQLNVAEISDFLGFSDVSYFYKLFKRMKGTLPSSYLKERTAPHL